MCDHATLRCALWAGTGPEGTLELEDDVDLCWSLSLLHLPPVVELLTYRSVKAGRLEPGPATILGGLRIIHMGHAACEERHMSRGCVLREHVARLRVA